MLRPPAALRAAAAALLTTAAAGALLAAPASAADAPLRFVGILPDGTRSASTSWMAINPAGTELIGEQRGIRTASSGLISRDLTTGRTTMLLAGNVQVDAASSDLQRIIIRTPLRLAATDTNSVDDLYLVDRRAGTKTLLSITADGKALGLPNESAYPFHYAPLAELSADGKAALLSLSTVKERSSNQVWQTYRYDVEARSYRELPASKDAYKSNLDAAGRVAISAESVVVDGRVTAQVPADAADRWTISANGRWAAAFSESGQEIIGLDTVSGGTARIPIPGYDNDYGRWYTRIAHVADDGGSVLLSDMPFFNVSKPYVIFARLDRSGALTKLGGDVPITADTWFGGQYGFDPQAAHLPRITPDGAFGFTGLHVAQLGSRPLPGAEPTAPSKPAGADYLTVYDARCTTRLRNFWDWLIWNNRQYSNPGLSLNIRPVGADLRAPTGFEGIAKRTSDGASKPITVKPNEFVEVPEAGPRGGFSFEGNVTLVDGTKLPAILKVEPHGLPNDCPTGPF